MRKIKFRARAVNDKKWVYGLYVKRHGNFCIVDDIGIETVIDPTTLGQFIVNDKNGKEIYEGDILQDKKDGPMTTVVFENGGFGYMFYDMWSDIRQLPSKAEVIGNIYETPELLK